MSYDPIHPEPENPTAPAQYEETTNFHLLLSVADSITSWLHIINTNMLKLDDILHAFQLRTSINGEVPPQAIEDILQLQNDFKTLETAVRLVEQDVKDLQEQTANLQALKPDVAILKQNFLNLDTTVTAQQNLITALTQTVQKLQENVESNTERITALENK